MDRSGANAARRRTGIALGLLAALLCVSNLRAQTPEEHASHHPGQASGAMPAGTPTPAGGTPAAGAGGMMEGMGEMMKNMGAPPPKALYPSLMDLPDLPPEKRDEVQRAAHERMKSGTDLMAEGFDQLVKAAPTTDYAAMQAAAAILREGVARFDSGLAAHRAIAEGKDPRALAMQWFKGQMNLPAPPSVSEADGVWGLSWEHLILMALLIAFAAVMIAMYFFKMRRAAELFGRIEAGKGGPPPGSAPPLTGSPGPSTPDGSPGGKTPPAGQKRPPAEGKARPAADTKAAAPSAPPAVDAKPAPTATAPTTEASSPAPAAPPRQPEAKPARLPSPPAAEASSAAAAAPPSTEAQPPPSTASPAPSGATDPKPPAPPAAVAAEPKSAAVPLAAAKPPAPAAPPTAGAPSTGEGAAPPPGKPAPGKPAATKFACFAPDATAVFVAGSFNHWDPKATPMSRDDEGNWSVTVSLLPGRHEFKFVVDGVMCCEPGCEGPHRGCSKCVANAAGTMNRVIEVT